MLYFIRVLLTISQCFGAYVTYTLIRKDMSLKKNNCCPFFIFIQKQKMKREGDEAWDQDTCLKIK